MAKPIKIEILGDSKGFKKTLGNVDKGIGSLISGPMVKLAGAVAGAFAVAKIADFGSSLFVLAKDLGNVTQKVSTVFGDQADSVAKWADGLNEAFGVTSTSVQLLAANTADLLKPMGFTTEAATDMAKEMVGLAPALAQWSGGTHDAAAVSVILAKALLGEREELKALGISINQAEVDMQAFEVAQRDGRDSVTELDKAIAAQELIFAKSTDAQAGYTAGTHTLTGMLNLLKARFAELKEALANRLTPAFLAIGNFLVSRLLPIIENRVIPAFQRMQPPIRELAVRWMPRMTKAVADVVKWFRGELAPAMDRVGRRIMPVLTEAAAATVKVLVEWGKWLEQNREALAGFVVFLGLWAIGAAAAAVSTIAAAAPVIALGVAIGALAVLFRRAYNENEDFRKAVDGVGRFLRDTFLPAVQSVGVWIRDSLVPALVSVASTVGGWIVTFATVSIQVLSYIDDIVMAVVGAVRSIAGATSAIYNAIVNPFKDAFTWITDAWIKLMRLLGQDVSVGGGMNFDRGGGGGMNFDRGGGGGRGFGGGGDRARRAMGGDVTRSGIYDVGERGRERVVLPQGARVMPAHSSGGGGGTINVYGANLSAGDVAREIAWRRRIGSGR